MSRSGAALACWRMAVLDNEMAVMMLNSYVIDSPAQARPVGSQGLPGVCDVVVDGPFVAARGELTRKCVGSVNQGFRFFTDAYDASIEAD